MSFCSQTLSFLLEKLLRWYNSRNKAAKYFLIASAGYGSTLAAHWITTYFYRKYKQFPPGLLGIPYFGSLFTLIFYHNEAFNDNLLPKYGPITMYTIGKTKFVSINDINLVKSIFNSPHCCNRPTMLKNVFNDIKTVDKTCTGKDKDKDQQEIFYACSYAFGGKHWQQRRKLQFNAINKISDTKLIESQLNILLNKYLINQTISNCIIEKKNGITFHTVCVIFHLMLHLVHCLEVKIIYQ